MHTMLEGIKPMAIPFSGTTGARMRVQVGKAPVASATRTTRGQTGRTSTFTTIHTRQAISISCLSSRPHPERTGVKLVCAGHLRSRIGGNVVYRQGRDKGYMFQGRVKGRVVAASSKEGSANEAESSTDSTDKSKKASESTTKSGPEAEAAQGRVQLLALGIVSWFRGVWDKIVWFFLSVKERRIRTLLMETEKDPTNADKEAEYLAALEKKDPQALIKRFESEEYPSNQDSVVVYLRALVATGQIDKYNKAVNANAEDVGHLLQRLQKRADGGRVAGRPGTSAQYPLHVAMLPEKGSLALSWFSYFSNIVFTMLALFILWPLMLAFMRRLSGASKVNQTPGVARPSVAQTNALTTRDQSGHKEYKKENLAPEKRKTFKDVKGCDEAKEELQEVVQYFTDTAKFTRLGGKLPKGVLLVGPPGTGKTLLAQAVAGEAGVPFLYRNGSEFEEIYVGVGSKRVRELFAEAKKKAPCIIFIDEIDAVGATRKNYNNESSRKTLNQMLGEMDGFEATDGIVVLAATNSPESLDPALVRPGRFDRHVLVPNPDRVGRQQIIEHYLKDKPIAKEVEAGTLARRTSGFSGADLFEMINKACISAAMQGLEEVNAAALDASIDRIIMGAERKSMKQLEEAKKATAYHEGGHAIVALFTDGASPIHKATILPRGQALGMVAFMSPDDPTMSRKQLQATIDVCMGGMVAEELIFGKDQTTTGVSQDLKQATKIARMMVGECGMTAAIGPVHAAALSSPQASLTADEEVSRILKESYSRARQLVEDHRPQLETIASALMEQETIPGSGLKALVGLEVEVEKEESNQRGDGGAGTPGGGGGQVEGPASGSNEGGGSSAPGATLDEGEGGGDESIEPSGAPGGVTRGVN